jgi:hypothetical protein
MHFVNSYDEARLYPQTLNVIESLYNIGFMSYKDLPNKYHSELFRCVSTDTDSVGEASEALVEILALNVDLMTDCISHPNKKNCNKLTKAITRAFEKEYKEMIDDMFDIVNEYNSIVDVTPSGDPDGYLMFRNIIL